MKKLTLTLLCLVLLLTSAIGLVGCDQFGEHTHAFSTKWSFDETYHWHAATCEHIDEVSDKAEHDFENNVCKNCGYKKLASASEGLAFALSDDEKSYSVAGIGTCMDTDIVIPSMYNNLPVTSIGEGAFRYCFGLSSIEIPDSVTEIWAYALGSCSGLTSVTIGSGVTSIGPYAFEYCSRLTSIIIPDSVKLICSYAFENCSNLTSVTIGSGVTSIEDAVFNCCGLTSIEVSKNNTVYHSDGNCLIETASKTLLVGCQNSVIPNDGSVTSIDNDSFVNCEGLTYIEIPDSVTSIGQYAFSGCKN